MASSVRPAASIRPAPTSAWPMVQCNSFRRGWIRTSSPCWAAWRTGRRLECRRRGRRFQRSWPRVRQPMQAVFPDWTFLRSSATMKTGRGHAMSPTNERGSDRPEAGRRGCRITRWESLVIVFVIGVALALLPPAIQSSRERSRRMACQANLRQIGLAINNYEGGAKAFSAGNGLHECSDPAGQPV